MFKFSTIMIVAMAAGAVVCEGAFLKKESIDQNIIFQSLDSSSTGSSDDFVTSSNVTESSANVTESSSDISPASSDVPALYAILPSVAAMYYLN